MFFSRLIGIDLGTAYTRIILPERGIVLSIPTLIAQNRDTRKLVAVGYEAEEIVGKTPSDVVLVRPLKNSVVSNFRALETFLKYLIHYALGKFFFLRPTVVISVPSSINSVEKRALEEAVINAGASEVYMYPFSYLSALGSDLDIQKPIGNMIMNFGAGSIESAIISYNGIVVYNSLKVGSLNINELISSYIKRVYGLIIGDPMSERIKTGVVSMLPVDTPKEIEVRGRDAGTGMPKSIILSTNDLLDAVKPIGNQVIFSIKNVLERTPPELSSDIVDNGIVICGGGVLLDNLDNLILNVVAIPVIKVDSPENVVANGIYKIIQNFDYYSQRNFIR